MKAIFTSGRTANIFDDEGEYIDNFIVYNMDVGSYPDYANVYEEIRDVPYGTTYQDLLDGPGCPSLKMASDHYHTDEELLEIEEALINGYIEQVMFGYIHGVKPCKD